MNSANGASTLQYSLRDPPSVEPGLKMGPCDLTPGERRSRIPSKTFRRTKEGRIVTPLSTEQKRLHLPSGSGESLPFPFRSPHPLAQKTSSRSCPGMQLSVSLESERAGVSSTSPSAPGESRGAMTEPWNYYQTFVFLDIESTGLPRDQPRIAELCLFAVHQSSLQPSPRTEEPQVPRIIDKLILCINPQKPFTLGAQDITGLSNQKLEQNCKPEINRSLMETLKGFLDRQARPICLVAHNGLRFDFPLLRKELWQIGTDLPADTGCLDTLQALKDVLREPNLSYKLGNLYHYFYREEPSRAHTAEGDVLTLLLVFLAKAVELKCWVAHYGQKWAEIQPMNFPHSNRF